MNAHLLPSSLAEAMAAENQVRAAENRTHCFFFPLQFFLVIYLFIHSKKQAVEETLVKQKKTPF